MIVQQAIEKKLAEAFDPDHLEVVNESHQHNVPPGSESHFKVVMVATGFEGQRKVARHQQVYAVLSEQISGPVHALALHTYTEKEWQQRHGQVPMSPPCLGGSQSEKS
jgi:BolA family transcriptional regulator, general stress-responsive regulator